MKILFTEKSIKTLSPTSSTQTIYDTKLTGLRLTISPLGSIVFYYRYRVRGSNLRPNIKLGKYGELTLTQARATATAYAGEVAKGNDPKADIEAKIKKAQIDNTQKLSHYLDETYEPWVMQTKKSGQCTMATIKRHFSHLLDRSMNTIKAMEIEKWQLKELDRGLQPSTVNRNLTALRGVLTKAHSQGVIEINPLSKVKNVKEVDANRVRFLDDTEETNLFTALRERHNSHCLKRETSNQWRASRGYDLLPETTDNEYIDYLEPMILLAMNTGLRRNELFQLKWKDIDFQRKTITVQAENAKSSKIRHIPLCKIAYDTLIKWRNQSPKMEGYIFKNSNGDCFTDIKKSWHSLIKLSGIIDFRFHDLRHHFASQLVMKGAPLNTVREFLGHADLNTTLRYAHLADDHKADAISLLD